MDDAEKRATRRSVVFQLAPAAAMRVAGRVAGIGAPLGAAADRRQKDPGPLNGNLDEQNPDSAWSPPTDSKSLVQNFKYSFSFANKCAYEGGWSRKVTLRELPVRAHLKIDQATLDGIPKTAGLLRPVSQEDS
jgi:hypothetical protein